MTHCIQRSEIVCRIDDKVSNMQFRLQKAKQMCMTVSNRSLSANTSYAPATCKPSFRVVYNASHSLACHER